MEAQTLNNTEELTELKKINNCDLQKVLNNSLYISTRNNLIFLNFNFRELR